VAAQVVTLPATTYKTLKKEEQLEHQDQTKTKNTQPSDAAMQFDSSLEGHSKLIA
jgi:hypothetical protein